MQIAFINPVGMIGGAERILLAALRSVRDHFPGCRPAVVLLNDGPLRQASEQLGARVIVLPLPRILAQQGGAHLLRMSVAAAFSAPAACAFLRKLRQSLVELAPDLIHSNGIKSHILSAIARPPRVPLLWHLHDFYSQRPVMARILRRCSPRVAGAVAVSQAVARDAVTTLPAMRTTVVRNAIDAAHYAPVHQDGAALDQLAGLPPAVPGTVRVGIVATYAHWKGQDVFLDALALAASIRPRIRGYVVGGPIYTTVGSQFTREQLQQRALANGLAGKIGFIPFQPDPVKIYQMLDVVVHASTHPEPFGLTIAEAMSCGKAVIVSAAGGAVELFTPEHDALGHTPGDVAGLASAITRSAADGQLRQRLGSNARNTAVDKFSQVRFGREIAAVYRDLLEPIKRAPPPPEHRLRLRHSIPDPHRPSR